MSVVREMYRYGDNDFIFTTSWDSMSAQSEFDEKLKTQWQTIEDEGLFRYKYKIEESVKLPGKYGFLAVVSVQNEFYPRKIVFNRYI